MTPREIQTLKDLGFAEEAIKYIATNHYSLTNWRSVNEL